MLGVLFLQAITLKQQKFLKLISNIQQDASISILLCTHTLEIAEAICDQVIFLYNGEVLSNQKIAEVDSNNSSYCIAKINGDRELFIKNCFDRGLKVSPGGDIKNKEVIIKDNADPRIIFQVASESKIHFVSLRRKKSKLEDLFLKYIKEQRLNRVH